MFQTVTFSIFCDAFRAIQPDNFTYEGLRAVFDYLEGCEYSADIGIEFDVIAICCEFSEYTNEEFLEQYPDGREDLIIVRFGDSLIAREG